MIVIKKIYHILKNWGTTVYWAFKSRQIRFNTIPMEISSIMFICKGNIIRSVFAEQYTRTLSQHIQIFSAGMDAKTGTPSPKAAVNVAAFYGINLSHHTSNKISPEQLHTTDVVFCMEYWHLESLEKLYPAMTGRLYLISQFDPDWDKLPTYLKYNIPDPYGKNEEQFHTIFNRIIHCLDNLFIELEKRKSK